MIRFLAIAGMAALLAACSGTGDDLAGKGTGSETPNTITGAIQDNNGYASGVIVTLYTEDFNPVTGTVPDSLRAITTSDGTYLFRISEAGNYNIQALHPESRAAALFQGVEIPEPADSIISISNLKITDPGRVVIHMNEL